MPIYVYECPICQTRIDHTCRIADRPENIPCPKKIGKRRCQGQMRQIIVPTAIQCDDAVNIPWVRDFAKTRKEARFGGKLIQTRKEANQYMKDHDLRPISGDGVNLGEV